MKIIAFADIHIGNKVYGKIDKDTGLNTREIDTIRILNEVVDYAISDKTDVVVFAGDMYKNPFPSTTIIDKVNEAFIKLSKANIKTFVLDGNHDVQKMETFNSGLSQFSALNVSNITQTRFFKTELATFGGTTYQFVFLPTHHTKEQIEELMNNLDTNYKTIIIGHLTVKNANLNDWTVIDNKDCIDVDTFKKENVQAVILGHLHKHQILNQEPLVFYTGSTQRIDFTEEKQKKGFVKLVLDEDVSLNFIPVSAQKFTTVKVDLKDVSDAEIAKNKIIDEIKKKDIVNSIVRIQLDLDENLIIDEKAIIEYVLTNNAQHILKLQKFFPNKEVVSSNAISNDLSVQDAIKHYFKDTKREEERVKLSLDIVNKVEDGE